MRFQSEFIAVKFKIQSAPLIGYNRRHETATVLEFRATCEYRIAQSINKTQIVRDSGSGAAVKLKLSIITKLPRSC